jgi:heme/copper-type cytochrome/quinol oxidase subunit 2
MVFVAVAPFVVFIVWIAVQARNPNLPAAAKGRKHKEIIVVAVMGILSFGALLYAYGVLSARDRVAPPPRVQPPPGVPLPAKGLTATRFQQNASKEKRSCWS